MSIESELKEISRLLRLANEDDLVDKLLCAYAAITDTEKPRIDLSYTYLVRKLRKGDRKKLRKFQEDFKEAFDQAIDQELEDPADIALMSVLQSNGDIDG